MHDIRDQFIHAADIARAKRRADLALAIALLICAVLFALGVITIGGVR